MPDFWPSTPATVITHGLAKETLGWLLALIDGVQPFVDVPAVQYEVGAVVQL